MIERGSNAYWTWIAMIRFDQGASVNPVRRIPWSYDELVVACGLYFTLPFGQMHARNPKIIQIARLLGRTPSSLAMKLVNFASLDPQQQARGIRGLASHSRADELIWNEFSVKWDEMTLLSEARLQSLQAGGLRRTAAPVDLRYVPDNLSTEDERMVKIRTMQGFFRKVVLAAYGSRCCITGNPWKICWWLATYCHGATFPRSG
jgi:putative restriction endonuclease